MARIKYYNTEKAKWEYADKGSSGNNGTSLVIDTEMSDASENAVQNKVIKKYVDSKISSSIINVLGGSY